MKLITMPKTIAAFGLMVTAAVGAIMPASAQMCEPLEVIDGEGAEVTKTVSLPGALLIDTNWNTDFAVSSDASYDYFLVNFLAENGESYDVDVHLKYPDESVDTVYSVRDGSFPEDELIAIRADSRFSGNPYQVNLRVGGLNAEGNTYTASVMGCR